MNPDLIRKQEVRATTYLLFQLKSVAIFAYSISN